MLRTPPHYGGARRLGRRLRPVVIAVDTSRCEQGLSGTHMGLGLRLAGDSGIEPLLTVLETAVVPLDQSPEGYPQGDLQDAGPVGSPLASGRCTSAAGQRSKRRW